jgi:hypothetical protein
MENSLGIEVEELDVDSIQLTSAQSTYPVPVGSSAHFWVTYQPTWFDNFMGRIAEAHANPEAASSGMAILRKLISTRAVSWYTSHRFASRYMQDAMLFYKFAGVHHALMQSNQDEAAQRLYGAELSANATFEQQLYQDAYDKA